MTTTWAITTMEGLGNRLHLVRDDALGFSGRHAAAVCAATPADGVIVFGVSDASPPRCMIWNADGSSAELCGNGLRCLVRLGVESGWLDPTGDRLQSAACLHQVRMESDGRVTVSMPEPMHGREHVGLIEHSDFEVAGDVLTYLDGSRGWRVHPVSTGNPHAVLFVDRAEHATMLPVLGPAIGMHAAVPAGINVHLVDVCDGGLELVTWERGVGPTPACATGATAAVAAAHAADLIEGGATVSMAGGRLEVKIESDLAWNTGAADHVGTWTTPLESTDADPPLRA